MKMKTIVDASPVLRRLSEQPMTIRYAYRLARLIGKINEPLAFYDKRIAEITEKYFDSGEGGELVQKVGCQEQIDREVGELLNLDLEQEIAPVEIPEAETVTISAAELILLDGIVKIAEEGENA